MDLLAGARFLWTPIRAFDGWLKKRGAGRQALVREGSEVVTPLIEFAKTVGPTGIMWGDQQQINERFLGWAEDWDGLRPALQTYANAHPSEKIKNQAAELVPAIGASLGATRYLSLRTPSADTLDAFNVATEKQAEAVALAERLMGAIRRY